MPSTAPPERKTLLHRLRWLTLCVLTVGLTTGASGCELFLVIVAALSGNWEEVHGSILVVPGKVGCTTADSYRDFSFFETLVSDDLAITPVGPAVGVSDPGRQRHRVAVGKTSVIRPPTGVYDLSVREGPVTDLAFGHSVSAHGSLLAVGAPYASLGDPGSGGGAVFLFRVTTSADPERIATVAPPESGGPEFATRVALDSGLLAVADPPNRVHVYQEFESTWVLRDSIVYAGSADDEFGHRLDVNAGRVLVGAPGVDGAAEDTGAAILYQRDGGAWFAAHTFVSQDPDPGMRFGDAIDLAGTRVLIGSPGADSGVGAAESFTQSGGVWTSEHTFARAASGTAVGVDRFGTAVTLNGTLALIGAPGVPGGGRLVPFVLGDGTWFVQEEICGGNGQDLGHSVAISTTYMAGVARTNGTGVFTVLRSPSSRASKRADPIAGTNRYLRLRPPEGAAPETAEILLPRTLSAPFRVQVRAGVLTDDQEAAAVGSRFVLGLRGGTAEYRVVGTVTQSGITLQATDHEGALATQTVLDGVRFADIAAQDDGGELVLTYRASGVGTFQEIARVPVAPGVVLQPFIRGEDVPGGKEIGFDEAVFDEFSQLVPQTASLRDAILDAFARTLQAEGQVRAETLDPVAAGIEISLASSSLDRAIATGEYQLSLAGKRRRKLGPKQVLGKLRKSSKKLAKAAKKLGKGKSARVVGRQIEGALKLQVKAYQRLREED